MTLDVKLPLGLLPRVGIMGCPWHGLVEGGELTLPNSETMTWPQPEYGDTKLIAFNGVPPVVRSVDELATDVAAGREWRNVAMLSGIDNHIYGQPLGRNAWLWQDDAGDGWKCSLTSTGIGDFADGIDTAVRIERFGAFGAPAQTIDLPLVLADIAQTTPVLSHFVPFVGLQPIVGGAMRVLDTTTTGRRALVEIYSTSPYLSRPQIHEFGPSMGYLEITLSGSGRAASAVATASVLRARAQTVGVYSKDVVDTREMKQIVPTYDETTVGVCPADAEVVVTRTATGLVFGAEGDGAYQQGGYNVDSSVVGRIVAMWYHEDVAIPIVYEQTMTSTNSTTLAGAYGGTAVTTIQCGTGSQSTTGYTWYSVTQEFTASATITVRVRIGAVLFDQVVWQNTESGSRTWHTHDGYSGSVSETYQQNALSADRVYVPDLWLSASLPESPWVASASSYGTFGLSYAQGLDYQGWNFPGLSLGTDGVVYSNNWLTLYSYSNHAIGLIQEASETAWIAEHGQAENAWRRIATPSGGDALDVRSREASGSMLFLSARRHASWNPVTGELVRDKTMAVSWV